MKPLSIQEIKQAIGAKLVAPLPTALPLISTVSHNSLEVDPGSLFIAIRGENKDGHVYLPDAASKGAIAAIVEEPPRTPQPNMHLLVVENSRKAMGKLATYARRQLRSKVIAVAGSNGKTSTKYLIASSLCQKLKGSFSPKSFNNDIGVPVAIFPADPSQDYLVLELGTNHHGEIKVLTDMALPDIAVITNCGAEHLEFLGDLAGVRKENASIIAGLNPKGTLIVNGDDELLLDAVAGYQGQKITFGFSDRNDLFATDIRCHDRGTTFKLNDRREFFVPMLGRHNACNALAAIAVARRMGLQEEVIAESLAVADGPEMRLQRDDLQSITLINDAYNANPNSMTAAMETLRDLHASGRKIAILGDMRELGPMGPQFHREVGSAAAGCELDLLICVGRDGALIADGAIRAGMSKTKVKTFADAELAIEKIPAGIRTGDLVLLKASRGVRLERVAEAIRNRIEAKARKAAS